MKTYEELQAENERLVTERDALAACISDACALFTRIAESEEVVINSDIKHIIDSELMYDIGDFVEHKTPQQCLREIKAEAVEEALDATYDEIRNRIGKDYSNIVESIILEYAAKVRQGGAE